MKRIKTTLVAGVLALMCGTAIPANATVIVGDVAVTPFTPPPRQLLRLVLSIPQGQGEFALFLDPLNASQVQFSYAGIAEIYSLYTASAGTAVDTAFAIATVPLVTNAVAGPTSAVLPFTIGQSVYFAYWDDRNFNGVPNSTDNFGWVLLTRTAGGLMASSSATAIGSGIIVGTTTQIPEPAPVALMSLCAGLAVFLHKVVSARDRRHLTRRCS